MLIDESQVAINDVIIACEDTARHYREAVDLLEDDALKQLFLSLGKEHEVISEKLSEIIRDMGGLPKDVDVEREEVLMLWSRIKAALAEDKRITILNEMMDKENHVQSLIAYALQQDLSESTLRYLKSIQEQTGHTIEKLNQQL